MKINTFDTYEKKKKYIYIYNDVFNGIMDKIKKRDDD